MSWPLKHLDQLGHVSRGRSRHRPRDAAHLYGGQFPFIQTGDVKHAGLYLMKYQQTYSEAGLAQSKLWPAGTLCITIAANIADTAILGIDACFPDSVIGFIPDPDEADARFVKYLFDATLQRRVKRFTQGAAQDNLSQEKLLSLEFHVPKVDEQRRIASIMSTYDNLIENNSRRIELLEESARLLYRDWFVYLRYPGHEHVNVVDGVPEGWERMPFEDALVLQRGFDLPSHERKEGAVPIYASTSVNGTHNVAKVNRTNAYTSAKKQLEALRPEVLLFVTHLAELRFVTPSKDDHIWRLEGSDDLSMVTQNGEPLGLWRVHRKTDVIPDDKLDPDQNGPLDYEVA